MLKLILAPLALLLTVTLALADFDRTDPVQLTELWLEVQNDPQGLGYSSQNTNSGVIQPINEWLASNGQTGDRLTIRMFLEAVMSNADDLTVGGQFTAGELEAIRMVFEASDTLDDDIEQYRSRIEGFFAQNDGLRQTLEAQQRDLSRAEVLWGVDTVIVRDDWIAARNANGG